jgi:putative transcription antitermination factor YqgF
MSSPGRILALDVGDRRIGLAITDALGLTAQPLFTVHRTTLRADLKSVARFLRQHSVSTVVVGNPLHMDGSPSPQAAKAQAFAAALREAHPNPLRITCSTSALRPATLMRSSTQPGMFHVKQEGPPGWIAKTSLIRSPQPYCSKHS